MVNIKKELIQSVYTLNKSLFYTLKIFRRNDSWNWIERKKLFIEHAVFVYTKLNTISSEKLVNLTCIAHCLCELRLLCHVYHSNHQKCIRKTKMAL